MYDPRGNMGIGPVKLLLAIAFPSIAILWLAYGGGGARLSAYGLWNTMAPGSVHERAPARLSGVASAEGQLGRGLASGGLRPYGNPLRAPNTVMTQGYGVGSHAPAEVWGAIDLALDGDGDGAADPEGSWDKPVYATHSGVVETTPNSYPAGNHIWVSNDEYRTGYSHLSSFAVSDGQIVSDGDLIGYIGSTGSSSGPHLDYQIWLRQGDAWINVNPLDYGPLDS